jgi:hypothetical protein
MFVPEDNLKLVYELSCSVLKVLPQSITPLLHYSITPILMKALELAGHRNLLCDPIRAACFGRGFIALVVAFW